MGSIEIQKSRRARTPRNRYYAGAKLSEHKFLRILDGFANGMPISALEPTTHVSGKTIRATYRALRTHLPLAAQHDCTRFAGAGSYLFDNGGITPEGRHILSSIEKSRRFDRYVRRLAPRLKCIEDQELLLLEKAVRIFCALDVRGVEVNERLLAEIVNAFSQLRANEPLQKLAECVPGARPHAHPSLRLYEDYRRYLLKHPL